MCDHDINEEEYLTSGEMQTKGHSAVEVQVTAGHSCLYHRLTSFRSEIAKRGPIPANGETFKDWARDGLKW